MTEHNEFIVCVLCDQYIDAVLPPSFRFPFPPFFPLKINDYVQLCVAMVPAIMTYLRRVLVAPLTALKAHVVSHYFFVFIFLE